MHLPYIPKGNFRLELRDVFFTVTTSELGEHDNDHCELRVQ